MVWRWTTGIAALAWLLGRLVLGTRWDGIEVAPGVWRDAIGLGQWALFWVLLAALALAVAGRLRSWPVRLAALAPLLGWMAWSLRAGALGPLPMAIYGVPTIVAWCAGLLARDLLQRR